MLALNRHLPIRYLTLIGAALAAAIAGLYGLQRGVAWPALLFAALVLLGLRDLRQTNHSVLRNYPIIGHLRFLFEFIRPEMRQYFIESDNEAAPFSRQQRSLVYQRAKGAPDEQPFGTQKDDGAVGFEWINHSLAPTVLPTHDFRVTIGGGEGSSCSQPYSASVFNVSAMSFGALSSNAILALNAGAQRGGFAHDTGEGSISRHHRVHGGNLIWEIGSGYFGCRNGDGSFNAEKFATNAREPQVKMIELKLSQGAKPCHGGVLPGPKVTPEIAEARGVPVWVDCVSPASDSAFDIARMMAIGADWCNAGRGFMFALGCAQAQACHTGYCPTGVTTQDPQRARALVVLTKAERVHTFHESTLEALTELVQAAGLRHPRDITASHIVRRSSGHKVKLLANLLHFVAPGALLAGEAPHEVFRLGLYWPMAQAASFEVAPRSLENALGA